jgi:hypothetical protein
MLFFKFWANVTRTWNVRKVHKILVGRLEYKEPMWRRGPGGKYNIKMYLKGIIYKHVVWIGVVQERLHSLLVGEKQ